MLNVYLTSSIGGVLGCAGEADPKRARGASGRAARAAGRAHEDEQSQVPGTTCYGAMICYSMTRDCFLKQFWGAYGTSTGCPAVLSCLKHVCRVVRRRLLWNVVHRRM
jgi:hypothetical protein